MPEPSKVQHPILEAEGLLVSKDNLEVQSLILLPRALSYKVSSQTSVADLFCTSCGCCLSQGYNAAIKKVSFVQSD